MLKIELLPARFGDCIWIDYGDAAHSYRVLIDGGTRGTRKDIKKRLNRISGDRRFELLVVTHIDRDHIEGVLDLLSQDDPGFLVRDLWFNGWCHLPDNPEDEKFGAVQGEKLTDRIVKLGWCWNQDFAGKAVVVPEGGELPVHELPGGLKLTLLSPTPDKLITLKPTWEAEVRKNNLDPGFALEPNDVAETEVEIFAPMELPDVRALADSPFDEDDSPANGSSIAFLAEFEGKRLLLAGDAHPSVLNNTLHRLSPNKPLALDLCKLPHHGSDHNVSRELLGNLSCERYVFSTNGSIYHHPDPAAVSRVIVGGGDYPELIFNYRSAHNQIWELPLLRNRHHYRVSYPDPDQEGIVIEL